MKAVILAGGYGTRLAEETEVRPKPMVEIGGKPILWHIMKICSSYGINDFILCLGYKGYMIKEYFINYAIHMSDVTVDFRKHSAEIHHNFSEPWKLTMVDTGKDTQTGGRLKRIRDYLDDEDFFMTYGDGVGSVNITELIAFHAKQNVLATVTAVQPSGRFGILNISSQSKVTNFQEKPQGDGHWINGGFFILSPKTLDYVDGDQSAWETDALVRLVKDQQLAAFRHHGFWHPMDTLRDKHYLQQLWEKESAPWKRWS